MDKVKDTPVFKLVVKYLLIVLGAVIYAVSFQFFMFPNEIVAGGVTGIAMIINAVTHWPVGVMIILMNVPLFLISWRHFGIEYMIASLVGMGLSSVLVDLFAVSGIVATTDPMLAAIIGGVIKGAGLGIIYYCNGSTGGIDIVIKFLRQRYNHINFGTIMLIVDTAIVVAYAMVLGQYQSAMYSIIAMYVVTKVVDLFLYGIDNSALCLIVSDQSTELTEMILSGHVHRGVTILEGEGAYSHSKKHVRMCVVKRTQLPELRRLVRSVDERAFFVVTDAKNVFGKGFESISEVR